MTGGPWTARRALSDGLCAAGLWYGTGTLALACITSAVSEVPAGDAVAVVLLCVAALMTIGGGLVFTLPVQRWAAGVRVATAIVIETLGYVLAVLALASASVPPRSSAAFPLSPFTTAMLAFAVNAGRRRAPLIAGSVLLAATQVVATALGPRVGIPWGFDLPEAATLALIALASTGFLVAGRRTERSRRASVEARAEEALTRTRAIARSRTAAIVHDTVLGDLAALAAAGPGSLPAGAADRLRRTLEVLSAPDWSAPGPAPTSTVHGGLVLAAVADAERAGLEVLLDGSLADLALLPPEVEQALAAAVEQCLVNTRRHAGVDHVEVTVLGGPGEVSVMVADAGAGFDPQQVPEERLGISTSVHRRIEHVGGSARTFARPGVGTTVLLTVPRGDFG